MANICSAEGNFDGRKSNTTVHSGGSVLCITIEKKILTEYCLRQWFSK